MSKDLASSYTALVIPHFSGAVTDSHSIHLVCMMTNCQNMRDLQLSAALRVQTHELLTLHLLAL